MSRCARRQTRRGDRRRAYSFAGYLRIGGTKLSIIFNAPFHVRRHRLHLGPKQQNLSVIGRLRPAGRRRAARTLRLERERLPVVRGRRDAFADPGMGWFGCAFRIQAVSRYAQRTIIFRSADLDERFSFRVAAAWSRSIFYQRALARETRRLRDAARRRRASIRFMAGVASNAPEAAASVGGISTPNSNASVLVSIRAARAEATILFRHICPNEAIDIARISAQHGFELWQKMPSPVVI